MIGDHFIDAVIVLVRGEIASKYENTNSLAVQSLPRFGTDVGPLMDR